MPNWWHTTWLRATLVGGSIIRIVDQLWLTSEEESDDTVWAYSVRTNFTRENKTENPATPRLHQRHLEYEWGGYTLWIQRLGKSISLVLMQENCLVSFHANSKRRTDNIWLNLKPDDDGQREAILIWEFYEFQFVGGGGGYLALEIHPRKVRNFQVASLPLSWRDLRCCSRLALTTSPRTRRLRNLNTSAPVSNSLWNSAEEATKS